ncbi:hypothetical protein [Fluviicola chungangensis]|uniref:Uncharacterized protein n=1 Tax=Fluviicola chungangensis TaxID=2597671 RepID=A0A556N6S4_9FLAO|nr:hypothetical protein [Fluviicola chungangensis]TSJ47838.1 hypothetical protein FO442_01550 [Fluviicola chungangensis]
MKPILHLVFLILLSSGAFGQTTVRIITRDRSNGDPISRVYIRQYQGDSLVATHYTSLKGIACFQVSTTELTSFELEHIAFNPLEKIPAKIFSGKPSDTLNLPVRMYYSRERLIDEVIIKPIGVPDTVFESTRVSVTDFEFLPDNNLLLLTYPKNLKKGTELVLYDGFNLLGEIPLPEKGQELIRDYRGNPHVLTEKNVYGITQKNRQIQIAQIEKQYYMTYIAPIVDTAFTKYYFSNFNPNYPAFDYFTFDVIDSSYRKIAKVQDDLMMELYRSEFKWVDVRTKLWAKEKENETGVDKEVWVGMYYFTNSIYYKELYAPIFERNDSIFLFDHYKNLLFKYNFQGDLIDSIPIYYHLQPKENGWKKHVIQDYETGEIYMHYEIAGQAQLRHFDTNTGKLSPPVQLQFKYPENIQIKGNSVYYIYRPFESTQKKYLYRERLPFEYKSQKINKGTLVELEKP